ncbi:hypothetical protein TSOC_003948 [Tetrabaena socialis]|uniref:Uncharacterized protein n=1 Tax=Tetrabaena socialis TaxID=47790 RepID=A0A2J8AA85_9CHLO|nr:hypothetical protein TSOC_003948 [Tetrabaena socialis]|eukprot:PNH09421.1 hypothetical protein TSOC_003948 [Tetrabaena socialis]
MEGWLGVAVAAPRPHASSSLAPFAAQEYEPYPALGVNWRVFGTGGNVQPLPSVLPNYVRCTKSGYKLNRHIKSIVNVARVESLGGNPHQFYYKNGSKAVNELKVEIEGAFSPPSHTRVALHHYQTRSAAEYLRKVARGRGSAAGLHVSLGQSLATLQEYDAESTEQCTEGLDLWQQCCAKPYNDWQLALQRHRRVPHDTGDVV